MSIEWCPNNLMDFMKYEGKIEILENTINFFYRDMKFNFGARDEIEIFDQIFLHGEYKIPINKESLVIDIGANVGMATLFFAINPNVSKIYSFEPFKMTYDSLVKNVNLNPSLANKVKTFNVGMGKVDKVEKGLIDPCFKGNSKVVFNKDINDYSGDVENYSVEEVVIKRASTAINDIIKENKNNLDIIIKMDCEGAEEELFKDEDFVKLLKNIKTIVMETHTIRGFAYICETLKGEGFVVDGKMLSLSNGTIKAKLKI